MLATASIHERDVVECINRLAELSVDRREAVANQLLASLPRSSIARIHRAIAPLIQVDILAVAHTTLQLLPIELALQVLSNLSYPSLLTCTLVSRRWRTLANDQSLWRTLCEAEGWKWKTSDMTTASQRSMHHEAWRSATDNDDEGVGEDMEDLTGDTDALDTTFLALSLAERRLQPRSEKFHPRRSQQPSGSGTSHRFSAPSILPSLSLAQANEPNYKRLHQTHVLLRNRFQRANYRLVSLQTRATADAHSNTIYCLQLFALPGPQGHQVLFTGSKDTTIRQWCLLNNYTERVFKGVHTGSVLTLCAHGNYLVSGGSDHFIVVWDIRNGKVVKILRDHTDSVLCVRFNSSRLVSCSKDRTVRSYLLPEFKKDLVFSHHRAAVNAVALSSSQIVSASGDRSVRIWDATTGDLLRTFEGHHGRGIATIALRGNAILSGSSDQHVRLHDVITDRGWSTAEPARSSARCERCSPMEQEVSQSPPANTHTALVRNVALGDDYAVSASYDGAVKVWDRESGTLLCDLTGGHTGRVFGVDFDCTKIISCGEDQRISIWDFGHGVDTSFVEL